MNTSGLSRQSSPAFFDNNAHIAQNQNLQMYYVGSPVWRTNGQVLRPQNPRDFEKIGNLYTQNKDLFLSSLSGHFALQINCLKTNNSLAATDRIGVHRLFWCKSQDGSPLISTSLSTLKAQSNAGSALSPTALYSYIYFHMIPSPLSISPDIEKLPPSHSLSFENGDIRIEPFWVPEFREHNALSIDALSENLHSLISESVSESIGDETHFATFLSGGLDSSTVTGVACNLTDRAVDSYSIGFDAKEYDETPFARETARHFGSQHHEYYVTPEDIFSAVPKIAAAYDEPFGNSSAMPVYYCAKVAADNGVKLMLAGDGGDELFAGNTRYASQRHYQHYLAIPKVLRKGLFDHLINALPAKFPLATKAQNYIKQADMPLPDRMQIYNFLYRHDPLEIFDKDYLAAIDTPMPLELLREQYHRPENASDLNRMLYLDWQFTLADNDLRKVSSMCELAGVDVSYPLITDRLMDFSCDIPSALKLNKGNLRYFFRYAMQEFLPQATLKKSKHGFGLPFGVWLKDYQPLHDLAYDSLEKLKSRHFFNPDFIDKVRRMHGSTHASYYGELIWIMMMLELWISSHQDNGNR